MLARRRHGAGVDVRRRAHLERHAPVAHERGEPTEIDRPVVADRDVVDDAHAMAEAIGAAPLQRLPDRGQPEASPAWIVMWKFAWWMVLKASR